MTDAQPDSFADDPSRERATVLAIVAMLFYQGYAAAIVGVASPWIGESFKLDGAGVARMFAWISLSSLGALALSRMIDRFGRRRMILWCMAAIPVCSIGAALSSTLLVFIGFQVALYAFVGAAAAGCVVMLSEELPIERRARGQSLGGLSGSLGAGLCIFLMPLFVARGWSWRWQFAIAAAGVAMLPAMARLLPESARWRLSNSTGVTERSNFYDVFKPLYRKSSITLIVCLLLGTISSSAANGFTYYHAVSVAKLSAGGASIVTLVGGGIGLLGFPLGAWAAERFGRVPTVVAAGIVVTFGQVAFFWGPPVSFAMPILWLSAGYCWFSAFGAAGTVAGNVVGTELYPTALRGTMTGWFALTIAVGSVISNALVAVLAHWMGGVSIVNGALAFVGIPAAIIFGIVIEETRGMALEASAKEAEFRSTVD